MHFQTAWIIVGLLPTLALCHSHGGGAAGTTGSPPTGAGPAAQQGQMSENSLLEMIVHILSENGGDEAEEALMTAQNMLQHQNMGGFENLSQQQRMQVLQEYIKDEISDNLPPPEGEQDPMEAFTDMMQLYIENDKKMVAMSQSIIMSQLNTIVQSIIDEEDTDTIEKNFVNAVKVFGQTESNKPPDLNQKLLYTVVNHLRVDPENDILMMMYKTLVHKVSPNSKVVLALVTLQWFHNTATSDELMEAAKEMLEYLMTETDLTNETPRIVPQTLVHHYLLKSRDRHVDLLVFSTMVWVLNQRTSESHELAAKLAFYIVRMGNKAMEIPDDEKWKWNPPGFCRIETTGGEMLQERACPEDIMCAVGPVTVNMNNTDYRITLCALPMKYMVYHACEVKYMNNTVAFTQMCPTGSCNVGPFRIQSDDMDMNVQFCSDLTNTYYMEKTMLERACAVVDHKNYRYMQRHCPDDYTCTLAPYEVEWTGGSTKHAVMCQEEPNFEFINRILNMFIGGPAPSNKTANDEAFIEFLVSHVMESADRHEDSQDPDGVGLMILHHMVDMMEETTGSEGLQGEVLEILERKRKMKEFEDADRKIMHMIIMDYERRGRERQNNEDNSSHESMGHSESRESSSESMEDHTDITLQLLRMLLNNEGNPPLQINNADTLPMLMRMYLDMPQQDSNNGNFLMQIVRMYLDTMNVQSKPSRHSGEYSNQEMADLAELLLRHSEQHEELSERQDDSEKMLKSLHEYVQDQKSEDNDQQQTLMEMIRQMMNKD